MTTEPYYCAPGVTLYLGDCIEVMRALPEASVDAVVCDPPYGLEFMGKEWDGPKLWREYITDADREYVSDGRSAPKFQTARPTFAAGRPFQAWCEAWAREAYRVLKPGGHLAAFGGTRTHHRLVCGIEDAGFEIRDETDWMFGSGFPKSAKPMAGMYSLPRSTTREQWRAFSTRARQMSGLALKPAHEPICLARKPLQGNVAQNVLRHGTGALNIDGTRIEIGDEYDPSKIQRQQKAPAIDFGASTLIGREIPTYKPGGRWPANVLLDDEAATLLDAQAGERKAGTAVRHNGVSGGQFGWGAHAEGTPDLGYGDRGGPSRFFFTAKASRSEREAGLEELPPALRTDGRPPEGPGADNPRLRVSERRNDHPTVKPIAVMRWLIRLVTPPGGVVLDPFLGSGTTALAALDERMQIIGIDMTERYVEIARYRVTHRHVLDEPVVREATEALPQGRLL